MSSSANEILTNLWLGDIRDSRNKEFINNVDIIINCSTNIPFLDDTKICKRISVEDNLEKKEIANLYKYLDNSVKFIHSELKKSKIIFIHCYAGKQRSASVICAYIMWSNNLTYEQAKEFLETKRKHIFTPLTNFKAALILYQQNYITAE